ncbi:T9SS type A sorting domain-containing protein [Aestuariibaculum sediminum]|uniref:T9SS type A sorting domain-containing protein n=1 Tax=Aestuariibaculum sediminum TaxID=2770637 RepID=A0A8J6Q2P0_9FLAO|nr:T9SS type A sorting domain-containing protein [Aestuariibaculum sediminum]MBD0832421.1 T9SS type A sorting domain-containing protein [Aestuariibaculum sediminum]
MLIGESTEIIFEGVMPINQIMSHNSKIVNSAYLVNCDAGDKIIRPTNMTEVNIYNPICLGLNFSPYKEAAPDLFPLSVEDELKVNRGVSDKEYGDIDNDGDIDILYADRFGKLNVLINSAGAGMIPNYPSTGVSLNILNSTESYRLYDWNGDGVNDLILHEYDAGAAVYRISYYQNNGSGVFPATATTVLMTSGVDYPPVDWFFDIGDLNNDNLPDILLSQGWFHGVAYFENTGGTSPYFSLASPQIYNPGNSFISNIFLLGNSGSYPVPEIYDVDCDGDNDVLISDPLYSSTMGNGGRVYFHENNGGVTSGIFPNINRVGLTNQFGLNDETVDNAPLACDWVVTRIVDYFDNNCPIAISYTPCENKFYYFLQEDCLCVDFYLLSVEDVAVKTNDYSLRLYPNPSSSSINVSGVYEMDFNYEIYDIHGKIISNGTYSKGNSIDISRYQKGMYLIKIIQGNRTKTLKFIKN